MEKGLVYQQNGLVGAQFGHLIRQKTAVINHLEALKPDLLIFSYGTNESYDFIDSLNYQQKVANFIGEIRKRMPGTGILIANAPDTRSGGRIPASEKSVNKALSNAARQLNLPFFDLFKAMGGWGSLYKWQGNKLFLDDLLHFNRKGASLIGELFTYALLDCGQLYSGIYNELKENLQNKMTAILNSDFKPEPFEALPVIEEKPVQSEEPEKIKQKEVVPQKDKKPTGEVRIYIVKKGDTLSGIAQRTGTSLENLIRLNQLKSANQLNIGQELRY
jgi:LysM repeat protein